MCVVADGVRMSVHPVSMSVYSVRVRVYPVSVGAYGVGMRVYPVRVGRVCVLSRGDESTIPRDFPRPVGERELVAPYERVIMICSARPAVVV